MIAFAAMLLAASIAAWIVVTAAPLRIYVRVACGLYAMLAATQALDDGLTEQVTLFVMAAAPAMLALAATRVTPVPMVLSCGIAVAAGIGAAVFGVAPLAFASLLASASAIAAARRRVPLALAAAVALVAGAASFAAGGAEALPALLAFSSAALIGIALVVASDRAVAKPGRRGQGLSIGAAR